MPNPPTAEQLRQQLSQLQQSYRSSSASTPGMGIDAARRQTDGYADFQRQQRELSNQLMAAQSAGAGGATSDRVEANREQMYGLATGRLGELRNDPVDAEIIRSLQGRATGTDVPFNAATTNAMFTARSEQANAGQQAAVQRLLRSGLTPGDPAFASALAELESNRQGSMQNARLNVDMNANQANYAARGAALGQLSGVNAGRNGAITNQSNYLSNLYGNETVHEQQGGATSYLPSFQTFQQVAQPRQRQAQQAQPARPAVAPTQPGRQYMVGTGSLGATSGAVASNGGTFGSTYGGQRSTPSQTPQPTWTATNMTTGASRTGQNQQAYAYSATPSVTSSRTNPTMHRRY